jgi:hypothetical protein
MKRMKNAKSTRNGSWTKVLGLLMLAGMLVLAGCSSTGSDDGGSSSGPATPAEEDFDAVAQPASNAASTESNFATNQVSAGMLYYSFFGVFVDSWDGETGEWTYTEGETTYTVTVEQDGNTWTWTWSYGTDTYVYTVTKESDRWTFSWSENGNVFMEGSVLFGGLTGSITIYDDTDNYNSKLYEIAWEPASDPYYVTYTATGYDSGTVMYVATVTTSQDGSTGQWSYDDRTGSNDDSNGSW